MFHVETSSFVLLLTVRANLKFARYEVNTFAHLDMHPFDSFSRKLQLVSCLKVWLSVHFVITNAVSNLFCRKFRLLRFEISAKITIGIFNPPRYRTIVTCGLLDRAIIFLLCATP